MTKPSIGLIFHGIGEPERALEPDEAAYWVSKAQFESVLDQIVERQDHAIFHITFDDGNISDHDIALPALLNRGLSATFLVLSGRIGQPGSLGSTQLESLIAAGMKIGSHGIDHLQWPTLSQDHLYREVAESRARLEQICNVAIDEAGIPFGRYDKRVLTALRRAGYKCAWSSDGGKMNETAYVKSRTSFLGDMTTVDIQRTLTGQLPMVRKIKRAIGMTRRRFFTTG